MRVKRVAVLSFHSSPVHEPGTGDNGGMTVYVREVARALSHRGVETDIFTRAESEGETVTEISPGVRVIGVGAGPPSAVSKEALPAYAREFASGIARWVAAEGASYDVIHSHYWQSGLAAKELSEAWSIPLVHSHHTLGRVKNRFLPPGDSPEPQVRLEGEAQVIGASDALIASTEDEWEQLSCLYGAPHDRLKTVHPGVDHRLFSPGDAATARRHVGLEDEAVLLYVGRIQPLKGLDLGLRAVAELVPALDREVVLLIAGGPSGTAGALELERLKRLSADLGIEGQVRWLGPRAHDSLPDFYRAADVTLICSHSESFGLAALEAHACGTPVVGTDVGGLSHVVRDGESGWLIGTRDHSELAGKLKTLLSDRDLGRSFGAASLHSASGFSWERTSEEFLELYECLVREDFPETCSC